MTNYQLDFSSYIAERTQDFTGREWVFAEIHRWLADPDGPNFFIITGEPGIGKTAIAGRLTQIHDIAAAHFCIARQADTIDPVLFARSISQQLCSIDGFAARILKDSKIDLKTSQKIQANYGTAIGIKIENLILNAPSPAIAFTHSVTQPLKELYTSGYDQQIIISVDALDEAAQFSGLETIIDLLTNAGPLPSQVRFVLTSRPDPEVQRNFESRQIPLFTLDAGLSENTQDVQNFLRNRIDQSLELQACLNEGQLAVKDFIEAATVASQGNFLYLVWLLRGVSSWEQKLDDLQSFPIGLDGIYREFLRARTLGSRTRQWRLYRPLLGVLAVARDVLTANQLAQFTQTNLQLVNDFILDVSQFLDPLGVQSGRYRLYHQSLVDFLGDLGKAGEFWVDLSECHRSIADFHWERHHADWSEFLDAYGLDNLAYHLYQSGQFERLKQLINPEWMKVRFDNGGFIYDGFLSDVDIAWQHAYEVAKYQIEANTIPNAIDENVRLALIRTSINSLSANYDHELVVQALETGLWTPQRVLSVAQRVLDKVPLYAAFLQSDKLIGEFREQALVRGLAAALEVRDENYRDYYQVILAPYVQGDQREKALERGLAVTLGIQNEYLRACALAVLAPHLQGDQREKVLENGLAAALSIQDEWFRVHALAKLAPHLKGDQREKALENGLSVALNTQNEWDKKWALVFLAPHLQGKLLERGLAAALAIQGEEDKADTLVALAPHLQGKLLDRGLAAALTLSDVDAQSYALAAIAPHLENDQCEQILERSLTAVQYIQNKRLRVRALAILAPHLQGSQQKQVLECGLTVALDLDKTGRALALADLAPLLQG
jgi:hypothetical protein